MTNLFEKNPQVRADFEAKGYKFIEGTNQLDLSQLPAHVRNLYGSRPNLDNFLPKAKPKKHSSNLMEQPAPAKFKGEIGADLTGKGKFKAAAPNRFIPAAMALAAPGAPRDATPGTEPDYLDQKGYDQEAEGHQAEGQARVDHLRIGQTNVRLKVNVTGEYTIRMIPIPDAEIAAIVREVIRKDQEHQAQRLRGALFDW